MDTTLINKQCCIHFFQGEYIMFIESIKENWKYENANDDAAVKLWNNQAIRKIYRME